MCIKETDMHSESHLRIDTIMKLKRRSWLKVVIPVLLVISLLSGCGSAEKSEMMQTTAEQPREQPTTSVSTDKIDVEAKKEMGAAPMNSESEEADGSGASSTSGVAQAPSQQDRKLIYRANLVMEVAAYEETKTRINDIIHLANGYTLQFSDQITEYERGGNFVIKIPSSGFQSVLDQMNKLEHLKFERSFSANDVTEEYVDLTSRLKARRINEARLLSYMEKAQNAKELLEISNKVAAEQELIEQIVGRMRYLDNNVEMSTIELRLYETVKPQQKVSLLEQTFGERVGKTLDDSLLALLSIAQGIIIVFVALAPFIVVTAILLIPILLIVRKNKRMRQQLSNNVRSVNKHAKGTREEITQAPIKSEEIESTD